MSNTTNEQHSQATPQETTNHTKAAGLAGGGVVAQDSIRNFCIIAHIEHFAYETPAERVSHRAGQKMRFLLELLFPAGGKYEPV